MVLFLFLQHTYRCAIIIIIVKIIIIPCVILLCTFNDIFVSLRLFSHNNNVPMYCTYSIPVAIYQDSGGSKLVVETDVVKGRLQANMLLYIIYVHVHV